MALMALAMGCNMPRRDGVSSGGREPAPAPVAQGAPGATKAGEPVVAAPPLTSAAPAAAPPVEAAPEAPSLTPPGSPAEADAGLVAADAGVADVGVTEERAVADAGATDPRAQADAGGSPPASADAVVPGGAEGGRVRPPGTVEVPGGVFERGSDEEARELGHDLCRQTYARPRDCEAAWFEAEGPRRSLTLNTFFIDIYEVTNAAYARCVQAGACSPPVYDACSFLDPSTGARRQGGEVPEVLLAPAHPVVCVTWAQAQAHCRWVGGRLPTEAEWEKAARGDKGARQFPWGDQWEPTWLNWGEVSGLGTMDGHARTAPVGAYPQGVSPYGAYDMAGNVWEWTSDWFAPGFYGRAEERNPINTRAAHNKVLRGGSWSFAGNGARAAFRHSLPPDAARDSVGFRCVRYGERGE